MSNQTFRNAKAPPARLLLGLSIALIGSIGCSSTDAGPGTSVGGSNAAAGSNSLPGAGTTSSFAGSTGNPAGGNSGTGSAGTSSTGSSGSGSSTAGVGNGTGGSSSGGSSSGGSTSGGGSSSGGSPSGGASGGGSMAGSTGNGTAPAGYWTTKDWHGCSWTGKETTGTTTIMPADFVSKAAAAPYCLSGSVGASTSNVALLGFNVNETNPASCAAKPVSATAGPPTVVPTATGLAINFVKQGADTSFTLRVQIQGPNASMPDPVGAADRWCATIAEVQGKVFVPWTAFTPSCWAAPGMQGTPYAMQPIDAVVFTVPGKATPTPYNFCVNGFTYGTSVADAPTGTATAGDQTGTVGGPGGMALDFARAKVNVDGQNYIIQNNNWGNPTGTDLALSYKNNSFKITSGSGSGQSAPAAFPSIYIGNNGNTANGVYSTSSTDHLPIQVSAIQSLLSTFRYSGTTAGSNLNAAYDIWFADSKPTMPYNDGISGFVMIWLRDPTGSSPIMGGGMGMETIAGQDWKVFKGPRGVGPGGTSSSAPVVSFVNTLEDNDSRSQSFKDVDINAFIKVAVAKYGISNSWYLTDVFAGFEIWGYGQSVGSLSVDEFKAVVK